MRYRAEIDGLRAVAVVPVILFHAGFGALGGGFVGVDVFFVISGFLITGILIQELAEGRFSIVNFYERRARRILPALFFMLLCCMPFAWMWLLPRDMADFAQSVVAVMAFASNILFWSESGYFDAAAELKPLLHTWSLAVEEQYYIVFPLLLAAGWRLGRRRLLTLLGLLFVVSLAVAEWSVKNSPSAAFFLLPARGWELLAGALAAFYLHRERAAPKLAVAQTASAAGLALILWAMLSFTPQTPFPGLHALAPVLGSVLIILFAVKGTLVGAALSARPMVGIGLISYSAYLWHQPLFVFARHHSLNEPSEALMLALAAATIPLAWFSWRFVERPFRSKSGFSRRGVFALSGAFAAIFLAFGAAGHLTKGFPSHRLPAEVVAMAAFGDDRNPRSDECISGPGRYRAPEKACILGAPGQLRGVLLGDSHSDAIAGAMHTAMAAQGIGLKHMWYSGCPPLPGLARVGAANDDRCADYVAAAMREIASDPALEHVVLAGRYTLYYQATRYDNGEGGLEPGLPAPADRMGAAASRSEAERKANVLAAYVAAIEDLLAHGKKLVLVYPVPEQGWDAPRRAARSLLSGGDGALSVGMDSYLRRNGPVIAAFDALGERPNLRRVRPAAILCDTRVAGRCVGAADGVSYYYDNNHLSNAGAQPVAKAIAAAIAESSAPAVVAAPMRQAAR